MNSPFQLMVKICPRCKKEELVQPIEKNALSRRDDCTWICRKCGINESRIDYWTSVNNVERLSPLEMEIEKKFCKLIGIVCPIEHVSSYFK